jgi:hypothetical protein
VIYPEQMAVLRRMLYMVDVEGRSLCAIQKELSEDGVPSPTGKAQWYIPSIRRLLKRDLYRPHTYAEMRELVAPDALARLEPGKNYGVYWFGERTEPRKRVSEYGEGGRVYKTPLHVRRAARGGSCGRPGSRLRHSSRVG